MMEKGNHNMNEKYMNEARERWGDTAAYKECEQRTAHYTADDWSELSAGMDAIMEGFAKLNARGVAPDHEKPHLQVRKLQQYISERMYNCTDEILSGLGQMYVADDRFTKNIDQHGEGTAAYVSECIKCYCEQRKATNE